MEGEESITLNGPSGCEDMELAQDRVQNVGFGIGGVEHSRFATRVRNESSDVFCKPHILLYRTNVPITGQNLSPQVPKRQIFQII
jgi:hypothetical protein